ncbi:MAG: GNAT family N-acetyltransferase [Planctomycetes bacterium HGW-Planctomycetes-1]|nr:MAG: GNAT family N-acetyltransferase [Planctomycetes bacterium HGW-Planctomycetes-1]
MIVRNAAVKDVEAIYLLISHYAQFDKMLFRSKAYIFDNLQMYNVAEDGGKVVGCCALQVIWADLAEIKSLAVDEKYQDKGVGKALVEKAVEQAKNLGVKKVFVLTLVPKFFEQYGFKIVEKKTLPMKVWSDCAKCTKQDNCDETAVEKEIKN